MVSANAARVEDRSPVPSDVDGTFSLGYRPELDGVRALAIAAVMAFHAAPLTIGGGYLGVDVFFVLSGFLITSLLVQERRRTGRVRLGNFYVRRALRLLPALGVLLVACAVYAIVLPGPETASIKRDAAGTVLYVNNWVAALQPGYHVSLLSHTWSLSIEEQFYVLWPAALLALVALRARRRTIVLVTAGGALASTVLRSMLFHAGASGPRVTAGLDTRAAALLVGCVVGLVVAWGMVPTGRRFRQAMQVASVVSLAWLAFLFCSSRYGSVELGHNPGRAFDEAYLAVSVAAGLLVLALVTTPWRPVVRLLSVPPIAWVGRISYGLYLWHFPVDLLLTADRVGFGGWPLQLARIGLTFAIAMASWTFVERPCLRLKRCFETERTADERVPLTPVAAA